MNAVYACGQNREFALADGSLPWRHDLSFEKEFRADMNRFRELTAGHVVIMGFNTYRTFSAPLKNRLNIVIRREAEDREVFFTDREFFFFNSIETALESLTDFDTDSIFLIGGAKLFDYAFAHNLVDGIVYETVFCADFPRAEVFIRKPDCFLLEKTYRTGRLIFNQYRNPVFQ